MLYFCHPILAITNATRFFLAGAVKIVVSVKTGILKYQVKSLIVKCLVRLICFKMNITRENVDALNAVVKVDIAKEDYSDKVEKILTDYRKYCG